jgi:leucyl-tRNA synthetase
MKKYDHTKIEKKWQKEWETKKTYKTSSVGKKKKMYVLDMFPYPSGAGLHVGHPRGYIGSDVYARIMRMRGFNVLHPMGYDAFGLPAEQYAIQHKIHPRKAVDVNVATFEKQLSKIGLSYDWSRKVNTTDPAYYKWTQWIFLKIYDSWYDTVKNKARDIKELVALFEKKGNTTINAVHSHENSFTAKEWKNYSDIEQQAILMNYRLAYEGYSEVNWCQKLGTVLANDEIVNGPNGELLSERGGYPVEKRLMRQWFMRISAYADRLLSDLDPLDWHENIKQIQRNWIGKSEGSEVEFPLAQQKTLSIKVFTTRVDTIFGVTYVVVAPEHPLVQELKSSITNWRDVEMYIANIKNKTDVERTALDKEKTGVELKGIQAINPANGEEVPVWISDYVLATYGTGAVMAVPAHDERDYAFAKKYKLPIRSVVHPATVSDENDFLYVDEGILINSGKFDGLMSDVARREITKAIGGKIVTKFKMRDAIFARQRYWGEPIPLVHHKDGMITEVKEKNLPLMLPNVSSYEPTGTGESPLAGVSSWKKAGYETNTMPGWAGSSWYFLRYIDPKNKNRFASEKELTYWFGKKDGGVDMYVGGAEHATGHLLYSRFWHKFLYDRGYVVAKEPFRALRNQGMIGGSDGRKMSKRWGNVINPDDVIASYGADALRVFEMFLGPFESHLPWSTDGIIGSRRFIERIWKLALRICEEATSPDAEKTLHKTIKKVTSDSLSFNFNTAVSSMMICVNTFEKAEKVSKKDFKLFLQILSPFAPHMTEELWHELGEKKSIHLSKWPVFDPKKIIDDTVTIALQINGKVRAELTIDVSMDADTIKAMALENEAITSRIQGQEIKRVIYVPRRLVNIVL